MKKLRELLHLCLEKNIPFASFRLPGYNEIRTWLQISGKLTYYGSVGDIERLQGFVYAPFHRRTGFPVLLIDPEEEIVNGMVSDSLLRLVSGMNRMYPADLPASPVGTEKEEYIRQADSFIRSFDNDFKKAVLSRVRLMPRPADFGSARFFLRLVREYPEAFCHLVHIPGNGTWTGATPETLLRIQSNVAMIHSLAGTVPENMSWGAKEKEEQRIVTDYIEKILIKHGISGFRKSHTHSRMAGNLKHLVNSFQFDPGAIQGHTGAFLSDLHPTPAVCGSPKKEALNLIFGTEKHNREYYTGFCGPVFSPQELHLFVNLRCMKILPDQLALFAGGGLTVRSDPEYEWQETEMKMRTLAQILHGDIKR